MIDQYSISLIILNRLTHDYLVKKIIVTDQVLIFGGYHKM